MNGGGAEREGDTEPETGSRLWAISPEPDAGLKLTDREIVTWAEVGRLTNCATQAPQGLDHSHHTPLNSWHLAHTEQANIFNNALDNFPIDNENKCPFAPFWPEFTQGNPVVLTVCTWANSQLPRAFVN